MEGTSCVWYRREDHAGLVRRLAACLIDAAVIAGILSVLAFAVTRGRPMPADRPRPSAGSAVAATALLLFIAAPYHVFMRRTAGGTVGYRLTGVRLITHSNEVPAWRTLLRRFLLSIIIPVVYFALIMPAMMRQAGQASPARASPSAASTIVGMLFTAVFVGILFGTYWTVPRDFRRQAVHDKWSRTWVVRRHARPAGSGRPIERAWSLGPLVLPYWDVEPVESREAATAAS